MQNGIGKFINSAAIIICFCLASPFAAGTGPTFIYWLAPPHPSAGAYPGNDINNSCTDSSAPCQTFSKVLSLLKQNGVGSSGTEIVLENGIYSPSAGTGFFFADCSSGGNALSGTSSSARVTIIADNERQAWIKGDGTGAPFVVKNCAFWEVAHLHVSDTDYASPQINAIMDFEGTSNSIISRNLLDHTNRCQNAHGLALLDGSSDNVLQENEVYYYHRHALISYSGSNGNEFVRNYTNYRNYGPPPASVCAPDCPLAQCGAGGMSYASSNLTWENNFFEGGSGLDDQSLAGGPDISDISHYGNVNLNSPGDGLRASNHANATPPSNISFTNDVVINAASVPAYLRCALNSVLTNVTIFNSLSKEPAGLFVQDNNGGGTACPSGATISATISKTEIFNSNPVNLIGFNIVSGTASISNSGTYNASSISNVQVTNPFTGSPGYGSCYLKITIIPATIESSITGMLLLDFLVSKRFLQTHFFCKIKAPQHVSLNN